MTGLLKRNMRIYFRDKTAVFFSLFGALIIIALYALFLGNVMKDSFKMCANGEFVMNSWVIAGLVAVATMTTSLGAYGVMVDDKANKIYRDFYISPIKRSKVVAAYILNSIFVGVIMTLLTFAVGEAFIVASGGELLTIAQSLKVIGVILLTVLSSSSFVGFICSFLKSSQAFSGCSIVVGSSIGFLVGTYVPMGNLPEAVQRVLSLLPCAHSSALLRQIMMQAAIKTELAGYPSEFIQGFKEEFGIVIKIGETECSTEVHLVFIIGSAILFYALSLIKHSCFDISCSKEGNGIKIQK